MDGLDDDPLAPCNSCLVYSKLTPSDGASSDYFGRDVSIDGDTAIIGAYGNDGNGSDSGSAYLYTFPMIDSDGVPHLPKLGSALGKLFVETYWSYPKAIFHPHNDFLVLKKNDSKKNKK